MNRFSLVLGGILIWITAAQTWAEGHIEVRYRGSDGSGTLDLQIDPDGTVRGKVHVQSATGSTADVGAQDAPAFYSQPPDVAWISVPVFCRHGRLIGYRQLLVHRCFRCGAFHP
jgi:hypothetical protein